MAKKSGFMGKLNKNDQGFTLLEMIIAITILAIIVIPLLRSFVISSRANAVAKRKLQASTVAQNLMEDMKACDLEDIVGWFREKEGLHLTAVSEEEDTKIYTVQNISLKGKKFDARITLDGSSSSNYRKEDGTGYNDGSMANLPDMESNKSAVYVMGFSDDESVAKEYVARHQLYDTDGKRPMTYEDFLKDLKRTIRVSLRHDEGSKATQVMLYITYECSAGLVSESDRKITKTLLLYDNYKTKEVLESVSLFYTPLYSSVAGDKDLIQIENSGNCPVNFYLIKMNGSSSTGVKNDYLEAVYKAGLSVTEGLTSGDRSATRICTNLYDPTSPKYVLTYSGDLKKLEANITSSENPEEKMRIYSVTVDIYKENSSFDEDQKLASLTGSRS